MLYELGIKFSLQGTNDVDVMFGKIMGKLNDMDAKLGHTAPNMEKKLDRIASATEAMSSRVRKAFGLAKAAAGAFITGKALSGISNWIKGNPEADEWKDYNRMMGETPEKFQKHYKELRRTYAGIDQAGYQKGLFDVSPLGEQNPELKKRGIEAAFVMSKFLGPDSNMKEASNLLRKAVGGFAASKPMEEQLNIMEKIPGQLQAVLSGTRAQGHDIAIAMPHVSGLYGTLGKSTAEMLVDLGLTSEAMGERAGEVLRNEISKQGEGFGKLASELERQKALQNQFRGAKSEADLSEKDRRYMKKLKKVSEEDFTARGAELLREGPEALFMATKQIIDELKTLSTTRPIDLNHLLTKAYGETAAQGLPKFLEDVVSGRRRALIEQAENSTPGGARNQVLAGQQSVTARSKIFEQRVQDAGIAIKSSFYGVLADLYGTYGRPFDRIADNWDENAKRITANMRPFVQEFGAGFAEAFGGLPDITGKVRALADALAGNDPQYWKDMGKHLGLVAGTDLKPVTASLGKMGNALVKMVPTIEMIGNLFGLINKAGDFVANVRDNYSPTWMGGKDVSDFTKNKRSLMLNPYRPEFPAYLGLGEDVAGWWNQPPKQLPAQAARPQSFSERMVNNQFSGSPVPPPPQTSVENQITVELDGDQIAARVAERVKRSQEDERDRGLATAGSGFRSR